MAAAPTVATSVGVLAFPEFGSAAEDLVGAVVPAAARHAGRGVVDVEPAGQRNLRVGGEITAWPQQPEGGTLSMGYPDPLPVLIASHTSQNQSGFGGSRTSHVTPSCGKSLPQPQDLMGLGSPEVLPVPQNWLQFGGHMWFVRT